MPDVLVVEDEFALCEFLTHALRREMLPFRLAHSLLGRQYTRSGRHDAGSICFGRGDCLIVLLM